MSKDTRFLNLTELEHFSEELSDKLKGRVEYKGGLDIIPTGATTRADWNDIILLNNPSLVGDVYKLMGTAGQSVVVGGITYMVGEYIIVTNEVDADDAGTLTDDITIMKFSSEAAIDDITIVHNDDAELRAKSALEVDTFPTTDILTETVYRVKEAYTDPTTKKEIKAGIYVYDTTDPANPKWLDVSGTAPDELTIRSRDIDDSLLGGRGYLRTAVNGYRHIDNTIEIYPNQFTFASGEIIDNVLVLTSNKFDLDPSQAEKVASTIAIGNINITDGTQSAQINMLEYHYSDETSVDESTGDVERTYYPEKDYTYAFYSAVQYHGNIYDPTQSYIIFLCVQEDIISKTWGTITATGEYLKAHDNSIRHITGEFIPIDSNTVTLHHFTDFYDTNYIQAHAIVDVDMLPDYTSGDSDMIERTIYRSANETVIGSDTYPAGLYTYNDNDYCYKPFCKVQYDEKTILSKDLYGSDLPTHTAVGGWQEYTKFYPASNYADSTVWSLSNTTPWITVGISDVAASFGASYVDMQVSDAVMSIPFDEANSYYYSHTNVTDASGATHEIDIYLRGTIGDPACSMEITTADTTAFDINGYSINFHEESESTKHPLETGYINIDKVSIVNDETVAGAETGVLHAKSAIEITEFPTDDILKETIYRLTADYETGGITYKAGLYVYDESTAAWISVGGSAIDEKTIIKNDEAKLETAVGGWKETISISKENLRDSATATSSYYCLISENNGFVNQRKWDDFKAIFVSGNTGILTAMQKDDTSVRQDYDLTCHGSTSFSGTNTSVSFNKTGEEIGENNISIHSTDTSFFVDGKEYVFVLDINESYSYHPIETKFISVDGKTVINNTDDTSLETGVLEARPIVSSSDVSLSDLFQNRYFIYYLNSSYTIDDILYSPGLYYYDRYNGSWVKLNGKTYGDALDQKTITNWDDKEDPQMTSNIHTYFDGLKSWFDVDFFRDDRVTPSWSYDSSSKTGVLTITTSFDIDLTKLTTNSFIRIKASNGSYYYVYFYDTYNGSSWAEGSTVEKNKIVVNLNSSIAPTFHYNFTSNYFRNVFGGLSYEAATMKYHTVSNEYINIDKNTLYEGTDTNPVDGKKYLHAKSALEITTFPTENILSETIYRLTADATVGTETYKAGLYVYDATNTKWIRVGGDPIDEVTVIKNTDSKLQAKSAIEITDFPTTPLAETMYRLTADVTVGTETYKAGLYIYDATNTKWIIQNPETVIDEKTIIKNSDSKLETAVGGWKETGSGTTFTATVANGITLVWDNTASTLSGTVAMTSDIQAMFDSSTYTLNKFEGTAYTQTISLNASITGTKSGNTITFENVQLNGSDWGTWTFTTVTFENLGTTVSIVCSGAFFGEDILSTVITTECVTTGDAYHPVETKFINIDATTIVNDTSSTTTTGLLRAKSAIEIENFPAAPVTETIYRLLHNITIGTITYKAGLYVYDATSSTWTAVSGGDSSVEIDNKTIVYDTSSKLSTAVGGYKTSGTEIIEEHTFAIASQTVKTTTDPYYYIMNLVPLTFTCVENDKALIKDISIIIDGTTYTTTETFTVIADSTPCYTINDFEVTDGTNTITIKYLKFYKVSTTGVFEVAFYDGTGVGSSSVCSATAYLGVYGEKAHPLGSEFINVDGISIINDTSTAGAETGTIKAQCSATGGLTINTDGLAVKLSNETTGGGLMFDSDGSLKINVTPSSLGYQGLQIDDNGILLIKLATNSGLTTGDASSTNDGLRIVLDTTTSKFGSGLSLDSGFLKLTHVTSSGTTLPTTGTEGDIFFLYTV